MNVVRYDGGMVTANDSRFPRSALTRGQPAKLIDAGSARMLDAEHKGTRLNLMVGAETVSV